MWHAARSGRLEAVRLLLQRGANVDHADTASQTPLTAACAASAPSVVDALLAKGAHVEARTSTGDTGLLIAANAGALEIVDKLLARQAERAERIWGHGPDHRQPQRQHGTGAPPGERGCQHPLAQQGPADGGRRGRGALISRAGGSVEGDLKASGRRGPGAIGVRYAGFWASANTQSRRARSRTPGRSARTAAVSARAPRLRMPWPVPKDPEEFAVVGRCHRRRRSGSCWKSATG